MSEKMSINKITLKNIMAFENLEINAGNINLISAKNGSGKTTIIEAIQNVFSGGNDATLIRNGAESGEIVLVLDDGTIIQKLIKDKSTLNVTTPLGKMAKPQSYLDKFADLVSINPIEFISAKKDKKTDILLESIPMTITASEISKAINGLIPVPQKVEAMHALSALELIHKQIYEERTINNRLAKDTKVNLEDAKKNTEIAGIDKDMDIDAELEKLEGIRLGMSAKLNQYLEEFQKEKEISLNEAVRYSMEEAEILRKEYDAKLKVILDKKNEMVSAASELYDTKKADKEASFKSRYEPLVANISKLTQANQQKKLIEESLKRVDALQIKSNNLDAKSESLTQALENLNKLKVGLLSKLPIEGLEVIDGIIYRGGIVFDRLNTAQQIEIAVEIAKLRAGKIGIICIDGFERLDPDAQKVFIEQAQKSGLQYFLTQVGPGGIGVTADNTYANLSTGNTDNLLDTEVEYEVNNTETVTNQTENF